MKLGPSGRAFFFAMYRAVAEFARAGVSIVFDDVMYDRDVVAYAATMLAAFDPLVVGIRVAGSASAFFEAGHRFTEYDLEVDTSDIDARTAATLVLDARKERGSALRRMRERFDSEGEDPQ